MTEALVPSDVHKYNFFLLEKYSLALYVGSRNIVY